MAKNIVAYDTAVDASCQSCPPPPRFHHSIGTVSISTTTSTPANQYVAQRIPKTPSTSPIYHFGTTQPLKRDLIAKLSWYA